MSLCIYIYQIIHVLIYIYTSFYFSELCWGKAMVAYRKSQQRRKKEKNERLRGEREIRSSLFILDLKDGKL